MASHSKYDPIKDAMNFVQTAKEGDFIIVLGLCGAYHIQALNNRFPDARILIVEDTEEDIDFLISIETVDKVIHHGMNYVTTLENLQYNLKNLFLPSIYNTLTIYEHKPWCDHKDKDYILNLIQEALNDIKSDFSVQSYFGKLWMNNIFKNLKYIKEESISIDTTKTCLVTGAGPSLEDFIPEIKTNRDNYFIIATDTSYLSLMNSSIKADITLSLDPQHVSFTHFMTREEGVFFFDITGNPQAVRKTKGKKIFFSTNHPFVSYLENTQEDFHLPVLEAGKGTVTIACLDLAYKAGFKNIMVVGADFGYLKGKPYSKGTYLDFLYEEKQNRLHTAENSFNKLMFRSPLIKDKEKYTTDLLRSYEKSFEDWIKGKNLQCTKKGYIYYISNKEAHDTIFYQKVFHKDKLVESIERDRNLISNFMDNNLFVSLLPFIAFLKQKNKKQSPQSLMKLALDYIVEYT